MKHLREGACRFVVKTTDQDKRKVFINICGSDKVPMAGGWSDGKVQAFCTASLQEQYLAVLVSGGEMQLTICRFLMKPRHFWNQLICQMHSNTLKL